MKRIIFIMSTISVLALFIFVDDSCLRMANQDDGVAYAMGLWPKPKPKPQPTPSPAPAPVPTPSPVPEPSILALIGTGVAGIGFYMLLKRGKKR